MLNVDWMALEEWNQRQPSGARLFDPDDTTEGGLVVFLSVRGPNSRGANNYAVRVYDAQRLRFRENSSGVTFASDVAFYVAGNFNCADPDEAVQESSEPMPCGPGDPRDRRVGKRPAAIVADTINVLSCAWLEGEKGETRGMTRALVGIGSASVYTSEILGTGATRAAMGEGTRAAVLAHTGRSTS
jgi:hypothetical protein